MKKSLEILEWLHATLIFALLIPLMYGIGALTDPQGTLLFYLKCLLVAVPVVVTGIAIKRTKTLGIYILICVAMTAVIGAVVVGIPMLTRSQSLWELYEICYCVGIFVETVFIASNRFLDRLRRIRHEKNNDLFELYEESFLDKPSLGITGYFVVMYVFGILFNAKLLCDIAFYSAIVYLFLALVYVFFGTTKSYLLLNKRTKGIPKKRLYGIGGGMLGLFAILLLVAILPSIVLAHARRYTDVRDWFSDVVLVPYEYESNSEFQGANTNIDAWQQMLLAEAETASEAAKVWNAVFWVIGAVSVMGVIYGIIMAIRQVFSDFRKGLDENGDKIEALEEDKSYREEMLSRVRRRESDSEAAKIRRLYRKTIRKHRKEQPAAYEAPSEIEKKAGLAEDEDMHILHDRYERVRYGKEMK